MSDDTTDKVAAELGLTREQVIEQCRAYHEAYRAENAWPADGIMPDDRDRTLLRRVNEAVQATLEKLPGLSELGTGSHVQECKCDLSYVHEPTGWLIEVTMEIRPDPDWDDNDNQV